jgi:hypothetical protein
LCIQLCRFAGQFLCSYSTLPLYALVTQVTQDLEKGYKYVFALVSAHVSMISTRTSKLQIVALKWKNLDSLQPKIPFSPLWPKRLTIWLERTVAKTPYWVWISELHNYLTCSPDSIAVIDSFLLEWMVNDVCLVLRRNGVVALNESF